MDNTHDPPAKVAIAGLLAGMLGALAVTMMVAIGRKVMAGADEPSDPSGAAGISAGEALADGPAMPPDMNRVTATFVQKIATGIFGTNLDARRQYLAGVAWHLAYGGFWGALYALLQSSVRIPRLLLGPVWGIGVWAIGPGWLVPKMKLMLPPAKQRPQLTAMVVGVHAVYGAIVALVFDALRNLALGRP
jgi:hypothetical protein